MTMPGLPVTSMRLGEGRFCLPYEGSSRRGTLRFPCPGPTLGALSMTLFLRVDWLRRLERFPDSDNFMTFIEHARSRSKALPSCWQCGPQARFFRTVPKKIMKTFY